MPEQEARERIPNNDELTRLERQLVIEQARYEKDPWYVRAVRPAVSIIIVGTLSAILIHGTLWAGDRNAFEAAVTIGGMILAFWFGGRQAQKK